MKVGFCVLAAVFAAASAIISQPLSCVHPDICAPRVIASCPNKTPIESCPTCCCNSTENVEFYDPDRLEPKCTAPPAVYTVKFVGTWSAVCHPDYYFANAHWSPVTGASHNTKYKMWDACMVNVSRGVALVSQTGSTAVINQEYAAEGNNILDTFQGSVFFGPGETSAELDVDNKHQWVSTVTMLAPSRDRMMGVANLRLCKGYDWKRRVMVCGELFSTATKSERVFGEMERNTIQFNNCSFGYFEFTFKEYKNSDQQSPEDCEFETHGVCPAGEYIPEKCRSCCCVSSENVEFYDPSHTPSCEATGKATYKVSLKPRISPRYCHSNLTASDPYFSGLAITAHSKSLRDHDKCLNTQYPEGLLPFLRNFQNVALTRGVLEKDKRLGIINNFFVDSNLMSRHPRRKGRRSGFISITPSVSAVTVVSKLLPVGDKFIGISGLNLCGRSGWKNKVEVCVELLEIVNKTASPDANSVIQGNQCSFGSIVFALKTIGSQRVQHRPQPPPTCKPLNASIFNSPFPLEACCYCEFILEGKVIRHVRRYNDPKYRYNLVVKVESVYYDEINHIQAGDVVEIKICSIPNHIKWNKKYRLTGSRECGTNELEISERGIFAEIIRDVGVGPCAPYILAGNCDR